MSVSVVVPDGALPGTKIQQRTPDGKELDLIVPEGVLPGAVMVLTLDAESGGWRCTIENAPPPAAAAPSARRSISVAVPEWATPGTTLQHTTEDGKHLDLVVPDGVSAGTTMTLVQDVASGKWHIEILPAHEPEPDQYARQTIVVPEAAQPGATLQHRTPDGKILDLVVPDGVFPGDLMVLTHDVANGKWTCTVESCEAKIASSPGSPSKDDANVTPCVPQSVSIIVPEDARPGSKLLHKMPSGQELDLALPEGVPPGSVLTLTQDLVSGGWACVAEAPEIVSPSATTSEAALSSTTANPSAQALHHDECVPHSSLVVLPDFLIVRSNMNHGTVNGLERDQENPNVDACSQRFLPPEPTAEGWQSAVAANRPLAQPVSPSCSSAARSATGAIRGPPGSTSLPPRAPPAPPASPPGTPRAPQSPQTTEPVVWLGRGWHSKSPAQLPSAAGSPSSPKATTPTTSSSENDRHEAALRRQALLHTIAHEAALRTIAHEPAEPHGEREQVQQWHQQQQEPQHWQFGVQDFVDELLGMSEEASSSVMDEENRNRDHHRNRTMTDLQMLQQAPPFGAKQPFDPSCDVSMPEICSSSIVPPALDHGSLGLPLPVSLALEHRQPFSQPRLPAFSGGRDPFHRSQKTLSMRGSKTDSTEEGSRTSGDDVDDSSRSSLRGWSETFTDGGSGSGFDGLGAAIWDVGSRLGLTDLLGWDTPAVSSTSPRDTPTQNPHPLAAGLEGKSVMRQGATAGSRGARPEAHRPRPSPEQSGQHSEKGRISRGQQPSDHQYPFATTPTGARTPQGPDVLGIYGSLSNLAPPQLSPSDTPLASRPTAGTSAADRRPMLGAGFGAGSMADSSMSSRARASQVNAGYAQHGGGLRDQAAAWGPPHLGPLPGTRITSSGQPWN